MGVKLLAYKIIGGSKDQPISASVIENEGLTLFAVYRHVGHISLLPEPEGGEEIYVITTCDDFQAMDLFEKCVDERTAVRWALNKLAFNRASQKMQGGAI